MSSAVALLALQAQQTFARVAFSHNGDLKTTLVLNYCCWCFNLSVYLMFQ